MLVTKELHCHIGNSHLFLNLGGGYQFLAGVIGQMQLYLTVGLGTAVVNWVALVYVLVPSLFVFLCKSKTFS